MIIELFEGLLLGLFFVAVGADLDFPFRQIAVLTFQIRRVGFGALRPPIFP